MVYLPPKYAVQSCIIPIIIYALMGTSRHMSIGPEASAYLMIGNAISNLPTGTDALLEERAKVFIFFIAISAFKIIFFI